MTEEKRNGIAEILRAAGLLVPLSVDDYLSKPDPDPFRYVFPDWRSHPLPDIDPDLYGQNSTELIVDDLYPVDTDEYRRWYEKDRDAIESYTDGGMSIYVDMAYPFADRDVTPEPLPRSRSDLLSSSSHFGLGDIPEAPAGSPTPYSEFFDPWVPHHGRRVGFDFYRSWDAFNRYGATAGKAAEALSRLGNSTKRGKDL